MNESTSDNVKSNLFSSIVNVLQTDNKHKAGYIAILYYWRISKIKCYKKKRCDNAWLQKIFLNAHLMVDLRIIISLSFGSLFIFFAWKKISKYVKRKIIDGYWWIVRWLLELFSFHLLRKQIKVTMEWDF